MRALIAALLAAGLASSAAARGEGDENEAAPGLLPAGGIMIFYKSSGPLSFVTMTPKDKPADAREVGEVFGQSCQYGLSIPTAAQIRATSVTGGYGNGSYAKALEGIKKARPEVAGLYDVRSDMRVMSILGIFRKMCTQVTARAFALK